MSIVKFRKEVSALPSTLDPSTLYMVRVGTGFDLYLSDSTGSIAHKINSPQEVFIGSPATTPTHPALVFEERIIEGQTVYDMKVNVP